MNDEEKPLKKHGVLLYSSPGVSRFSSVGYLINLLSALHISKEIRKRWTDDHHTLQLIKDIQEYIGRNRPRDIN